MAEVYTADITRKEIDTMSAEAITPEEFGEVIPLFTPDVSLSRVDALIQRRRELHVLVGELAVQLNDVNVRYMACIQDILATNAALAAERVDTNALARELQAEVRPGSAIAGYGHPE